MALRDELIAKQHGYSPARDKADGPGGPTITVIDPSGTVLRFAQSWDD